MSRLWPDRLLVSLEPAAVRWVRLTGIRRRRIAEKRTLDADPGFGTEPWRGALEALRRQAGEWRREALRVTVVLSNCFVRYALVPAPGASGRDEALALARFQFAKIHGGRARDWEVRLTQSRIGASLPACAIDKELLTALEACFPRSARPRLVSVQPYLMSAFNHWRDRMPKAGGWLLLTEPHGVCAALHAGGEWRAIRTVRTTACTPADLEALLERERYGAGVDPVPHTVLLRADHGVRAALEALLGSAVTRLEISPLPGLFPDEIERYALGLSAR